jgi:hypothetical protein
VPVAVAAALANDANAAAKLAAPPDPWPDPEEKLAAVAFKTGPILARTEVTWELDCGDETEGATRTEIARLTCVDEASKRRLDAILTTRPSTARRRRAAAAAEHGLPEVAAVFTALPEDTAAVTVVPEPFTTAVELMATSAKDTFATHARPARRSTPTEGVVTTAGVTMPLSSNPTPICMQTTGCK